MRKTLPVAVCAAAILGIWSSNTYGQSDVSGIGADLAVIRQATAKYHLVENAVADGYVYFPGIGGNPGGPDAFYVKLAAIFDGPPASGGIPGVLKLDQPEILAYVKLPNGELRLASVFFMKPYAPGPFQGVPPPIYANDPAPVWLGHQMDENVNYGFWEMEVWVWVNNPTGIFDYYNPRFEEDWDIK